MTIGRFSSYGISGNEIIERSRNKLGAIARTAQVDGKCSTACVVTVSLSSLIFSLTYQKECMIIG